MAKEVKKICQVCGKSFLARRDAKTCSPTCRKRLERTYKFRLIDEAKRVEEEAKRIEVALKEELQRIAASLLPEHVAYAGAEAMNADSTREIENVNQLEDSNGDTSQITASPKAIDVADASSETQTIKPTMVRPEASLTYPGSITYAKDAGKIKINVDLPTTIPQPNKQPDSNYLRRFRALSLSVVVIFLLFGAGLIISLLSAKHTQHGLRQLDNAQQGQSQEALQEQTITNNTTHKLTVKVNALNTKVNNLKVGMSNNTYFVASDTSTNNLIGNVSSAHQTLGSDVTLAGNSFNGPNQLVQLGNNKELPSVDGSNLTAVNAIELQGDNASFYTNASNISSGTINDSRLSNNVALLSANNVFGASNTFNSTVILGVLGSAGNTALCLNGSNQLASCGGSGSGVTSLDGLVGALTLSDSTPLGSTITIDSASSTQLGLTQYGSTANTAAQGNTSLSFTGTGNLTGTVSGTAGGGITTNTLALVNSPTFSGTLAVQGSGGVTVGSTSSIGVVKLLDGTNDGFTASLGLGGALSSNQTYTLPATGGTLCTASSCSYTGTTAGGDLTGTYPNPTIASLQGNTLTLTSPSSGQVLQYNGSAFVNGLLTNSNLSAGTFSNIIGVGALAAGSIASGFGNINIGSNTFTGNGSGLTNLNGANLATGTVANAALTNSSLTVTAGTGLNGGGSVALGGSTSLSVAYGSTANTAAQGNTSLSFTGTGNLTGTVSGTAGGGITTNTLALVNSPTFSGTLAVQGASALTLGMASSHTGAIVFQGSGGTGTLTLQGPTTPNTGNYTLSIPTITANDTICTNGTQATACTNYAPTTGGNYIAKNTNDTSSASYIGNLIGLTNINTGAAGVLSLTNNGTNSALSILQSGTSEPGTSQALISANNNTITPTGNLISLQNQGTNEFSVDVNGNVTASGTYNTNTFNSSTLTFGGASTAAIQSASGQALNIIGNAASTWSTTVGNLSIQAAGTNTLSLDTAGAGTVNVGTNASIVTLGSGTGTQTVNVGDATAGSDTVNIGVGLGSDVVNIGTSSNPVSSLNTYGIARFQTPSAGSTTAFQIQNTGSNTLFNADTTDSQIAITGTAPAAVSGVVGTTPLNTFTVTGSAGGAVTSGAFTGGAGAGINLTSGAGGASSSTAVNSNGGTITIQGGAAGTGGSGTAGSIGAVNINTGGGTVSIGATGSTAVASTVNIGNTTAAGSVQSINIGSTASANNAVLIQGGTGTSAISLQIGASGTISIGTTSQATTLKIGNTSASATALINGGTNGTAISLQAGTGGSIILGTNNVNNVTIGSTANTGTLTFGQSTTGETISIGNGNVASGDVNTITIGHTATSTGKDVITIGNEVAASSLTLQGGTGNVLIDSSAAVNVGTANATSLAFGNTANNAGTIFKQTASSTAFEVQNATGAVLTVDTSNNQIVLGQASTINGQLAFDNSSNNNIVTLLSGTTTASYSLDLPTATGSSGQCLELGGSSSQLVFNSCIGVGNSGVAFPNSSNSNTVTLVAGITTASYSLTLPTTSGSSGQCLELGGSSSQLAFGSCGTSTGLAKNAADTSSAAVSSGSYLYQFTNSNSSSPLTSGVLQLNNDTNTNSTLNVTTSGNPVSGQAVITASDTNSSASGELLNLQSGSTPTSVFNVNTAGTVTIANGQSYTGTGVVTLSSGGANALNLDTGGAANIVLGATNASTVLIGASGTGNTIQHLLQLNSVTTLSESASCGTSTNQGTLYYNTTSNTIRACINGGWQDLVSTSSLSQLLFGVIPNSGNNPGDLVGASANSTTTGGPCKVVWASATSVAVNPCLAYSNGREVSVPQTTISVAGLAASSYQNICLGSGSSAATPALVGSASTTFGSETVNNLSNSSPTTLGQPLLCLATIETSGTAGNLSRIYDIRTFTTTNKTYGTLSGATPQVLGGLVITSTAGLIAMNASATGQMQGVLVAATGTSGTSGTPNAMYAISGPQWITANAGTQGGYVIGTSAAGGVASGAGGTALSAYDQAGIDQSGIYASSCTTNTFNVATNCQYSVFTNLEIQ